MMRIIFVVLSLLGFADSTFLVWDTISVSESCGAVLAQFGIASCTSVTSSEYGTLLGYPISILGMVGYAAVGILAVRGGEASQYRRGIFITALLGFLFSLYLFYLQWIVLESWCAFCLISAGLMTMIFLTSIVFLGGPTTRYYSEGVNDVRDSFFTVVKLFIVIIVLFEVGRGRMLVFQLENGTLTSGEAEDAETEVWVGKIDGELLGLTELRMLTGALNVENERAAYEYLLLSAETKLTGRSLEEMINDTTGLHLYKPAESFDVADTGVSEGDGSEGAGTVFDENGEVIGDSEADVGGVVVLADATLLAGGDEFLDAETIRGLHEDQFQAYVLFLERAATRGQAEAWQLFVTDLEVQHNAGIIVP